MSTFFMSDSHAYHSNICSGTTQWGGSKEQTRVFDTPEEMTQEIIKNINKYVKHDDVLYHLGDWSFAGFPNIKKFRDQINCRNIHLILGNHDHHIENNKENIQSIFSSVQHLKEVSVEGQHIIMLHYSMRVWKGSHKGFWHLYGHSHAGLEHSPNGKSIDVGVDNAFRLFGEYRPFSFEELKTILNKRQIEYLDNHNENTNV